MLSSRKPSETKAHKNISPKMKFQLSTNALFAILLATRAMSSVKGHGFMSEPPARNFIASVSGLTYGSEVGKPPREYCKQCLNQNAGVCGITQDGTTDYDAWLDTTGSPMPFIPQRTLVAGSVIDVRTGLTANHGGHMELRGCPNGRASTQECFDRYKFEFVSDEAFDMPKDLNHPERGYYFGGQGANNLDFHMKFRVPDGLTGQEVLLQWHYFTANSCSPPGYAEYFSGQNSNNQPLPDTYWSPGISVCTLPYQNTGGSAPERFWNCAEVTVVSNDGSVPIPVPAPTPLPVVPEAVPTLAPQTPRPNLRTPAPVNSNEGGNGEVGGTCGEEWASCFEDNNSCCEDNFCDVYQWYAQCRRRPDACLLEWNQCNDRPNDCCAGLTCKGDGSWKSCKK